MNVVSLMRFLGEIEGLKCYWAEPGKFAEPGFYFWDGHENIRVPLVGVSKMLRAITFYAKHEHWMTLTDDADALHKVLVANGNTESCEGWAMAEMALEAAVVQGAKV